MRRELLWVVLATAVVSCAPPPPPPAISAASAVDGPKYEVDCAGDTKNSFGEMTSRKNCKISVTDSGHRDSSSSRSAFHEDIVRISAAGLSVGAVYYRSQGCANPPPLKMAVDGKRIDGLPPVQRIAAMKAGTIVSYEVPNNYPGCQYFPTMPYSARLTGFAAAYDEMMARWSKI